MNLPQDISFPVSYTHLDVYKRQQYNHIGNNLGQVQYQVNNNKEKIEEIQRRELINIREELEVL